MENEKINENEINILDMLFVIRKHIWKIIIAAIVAAVLAFVYTITSIVPMYRSTTQILIKDFDVAASNIYMDSTSKVMLVNNSMEVLNGSHVMQEVIDSLSLDMTTSQLRQCVSISSPEDTLVIKISAVHSDPEVAKDIASEFCTIANEVLAKNIGITSLSVIEEAETPTNPISPNTLKNTIMGGFAGAFIVAALVILLRLINSNIYNADDVERSLGLIVFASIPYVEEKDASKISAKKVSDKKEGAKK